MKIWESGVGALWLMDAAARRYRPITDIGQIAINSPFQSNNSLVIIAFSP